MVKKYASIDFFRGFAIFMMVFVHTLMRWIDQGHITDNLETYPIIILVVLMAVMFFGGWCGFFLLTSATGNMVSMYKNLKRNGSVKTVVLKQVIGGFLLLFCAVLSESILGYHAALGELALGNEGWWWDIINRGFHMETIHAVAWCVIINGLVQGLLSMNGGWKKIKRNIRIYIILAVVVVLAAVPIWEGVRNAFPEFGVDYPYGTRDIGFVRIFGTYMFGPENKAIQYGFVGIDPFWSLVKQFFLSPLSGGPEPLFPFLAVSFIGSVIGLFLMKKEDEKEENPDKIPSSRPVSIGLLIGFIMFIVGLLLTGVLAGFSPEGGGAAMDLMRNFYDVRGLYEATLNRFGFGFSFIWLTWFITLTGAQLCAILMVLRAVEFRGKAKRFGKKTRYFSRFGLVAFSIYNFQMIDIAVIILFAYIGKLLPGVYIPGEGGIGSGYAAIIADAWKSYDVNLIFFVVIGVFLLHSGLLLLWEKMHFTLGFEWFLSKTANILVPSKRKGRKREGFFKTARLDPQKNLYDVDYIEIVPDGKVQHAALVDSKLSARYAWIGLLIPPMAPVALGIARTALKTESKNKYSNRGFIISIISISFYSVLFIAMCFIPGFGL